MGIGHEGRPTLLAVDDETDAISVPVKTIQHREVTFAGHTKGMRNALGDQAFDQQVAANSRCGIAHASVLRPTPNAAPTLSNRINAAPKKVAAYRPRSIRKPNNTGAIANPTSNPE